MLLPRIADSEFLMQFVGQADRPERVAAARSFEKRFSIALSEELELIGLQASTISIRADLTKEKPKSRSPGTHIKLSLTAAVPQATYGQFIDATLAAKTRCLSNLGGGSRISINAYLQR
jgi:hypothetical protein